MCEDPGRHGRAADALIASYLRELIADEPEHPQGDAARTESPALAPAPALAPPSGPLQAEAAA